MHNPESFLLVATMQFNPIIMSLVYAYGLVIDLTAGRVVENYFTNI